MADLTEFEVSLCKKIANQLQLKYLLVDHQRYVIGLFRSIPDKKTFSKYPKLQFLNAISTVLAGKLANLIQANQTSQTNQANQTSQPNQANQTSQPNSQPNSQPTKPNQPNSHQPTPNHPDEQFDLRSYQTKHLIDDGDNDQYSNEQHVTGVTICNFMGVEDFNEFKLLVNPESMYEHYYLVLDSDYRDKSRENPSQVTQFTWSYAPTQNVAMGFCNSIGIIQNIIGMRMYQPRIPYVAAMNTSGKRVSILVKELQAQAFITETGSRFHFLLRPEYTTATTSIELSTEDYNDGIFTFSKPITEFTSQTIIFGNPIDPITFTTPFDRFIIPIEYTCIKDFNDQE